MPTLPNRCSLLLLGALPALLYAGAAESEVSKQRAQVESVQAGDIACYLQLSDGRSLMADFALCDDRSPPLRQPIWLLSEPNQVAAASCEGDPECADSDTVDLVVDWQADDVSKPAVCASGSNLVFTCSTGRKQVALCQQPDGQLTYRFGADLSQPEKTLVAPSASDRVEGATVAFAGGGAAWLRLREGRHAYVLYSGIGRWGDNGEPAVREGISVERDGQAIANIRCADEAISELGPDWFEQQRVRAADPDDFDLPI